MLAGLMSPEPSSDLFTYAAGRGRICECKQLLCNPFSAVGSVLAPIHFQTASVGWGWEGVEVVLRAFAMIVLLLLPSAVLYAAGEGDSARIVALGTLLAFHVCVLARPIASFAVLIPAVYAAAAITSNTVGIAALIVAIAFVIGAASSLGY